MIRRYREGVVGASLGEHSAEICYGQPCVSGFRKIIADQEVNLLRRYLRHRSVRLGPRARPAQRSAVRLARRQPSASGERSGLFLLRSFRSELESSSVASFIRLPRSSGREDGPAGRPVEVRKSPDRLKRSGQYLSLDFEPASGRTRR